LATAPVLTFGDDK